MCKLRPHRALPPPPPQRARRVRERRVQMRTLRLKYSTYPRGAGGVLGAERCWCGVLCGAGAVREW